MIQTTPMPMDEARARETLAATDGKQFTGLAGIRALCDWPYSTDDQVVHNSKLASFTVGDLRALLAAAPATPAPVEQGEVNPNATIFEDETFFDLEAAFGNFVYLWQADENGQRTQITLSRDTVLRFAHATIAALSPKPESGVSDER